MVIESLPSDKMYSNISKVVIPSLFTTLKMSGSYKTTSSYGPVKTVHHVL